MTLPFGLPGRAAQPFSAWISGVRPLLFFTFWLNSTLFGDGSFSYHVVNVGIHAINGALVFLVLRRWLSLAKTVPPRVDLLAGLGAGLFLLHPLQSESVAYVASRSETLTAMFLLLALAVFLYRPAAEITWGRSTAVLALFGAACLSKEHAVALVPVLLLCDYYWNPGFTLAGIRKNWRLYVPLGGAALVAAGLVWRLLAGASSAGFGVKDFTWYEYFFTQCRAVFLYVRLFFVPAGQSVDHDLAISKSLLDHGAILGLAAILALMAAAFLLRRKFPLASFGILAFVIFLAPTSSFIPIRDAVAEHRAYLPLLGLILVCLEFLRLPRLNARHIAVAGCAVLLICTALTYGRSEVWSSAPALWSDAAAKAPRKARPYANLASVYLRQKDCQRAARVLREASSRVQPDQYMLVTWGAAEACVAQFDLAADLLRKATQLQPDAKVYALLGSVLNQAGKRQESYFALEKAMELDPALDVGYLYRGEWYERAQQLELAANDYRRALEINPDNVLARRLLASVEARMRAGDSPFSPAQARYRR